MGRIKPGAATLGIQLTVGQAGQLLKALSQCDSRNMSLEALKARKNLAGKYESARLAGVPEDVIEGVTAEPAAEPPAEAGGTEAPAEPEPQAPTASARGVGAGTIGKPRRPERREGE